MFVRGLSRVSLPLARELFSTSRSGQYQAFQHVARLSTMPLRDEKRTENEVFSSNGLKMKIVTNDSSTLTATTNAKSSKTGITLIKHPYDLARSTAVPEPIAPNDQLFAIFRLLGKQFKVTKVEINSTFNGVSYSFYNNFI